MRKQTKLVAVASAAALLAIGASMTSFAATGWVEEGGEWFFYEKDGSKAEDVWKKSGDKWFWLDSEESGAMAIDKLVEDGDNIYYVDSTGAMVANTWVKVVNEDQDDEDDPAEYNYYYMQNNGKAYKGNDTTKFKTIDGKRYTFDSDGKMLYGWVGTDGSRLSGESDWEAVNQEIYYCGNWDDGAMKTGWQKINVYDNEEEDNMDYWFYFKSNGKRYVQKADAEDNYLEKTVNGKKYGFDDRGVMVYEWVIGSGSEGASASDWKYFSSPEDGARKTKGWFKVVAPDEDSTFGGITNTFDSSNADDETEKWYYADGKGYLKEGAIEKIKGKYYAFHEDTGYMLTGLCYLSVNEDGTIATTHKNNMDSDYLDDIINEKDGVFVDGAKVYYFGNDEDHDGAMKTGSVTVSLDGESFNFLFSKTGGVESRGQGVTGIDDGKFIYKSGKKLKASSDDKLKVVTAIGDVGDENAVVKEVKTADLRNEEKAALKGLSLDTYKNNDLDSVKIVTGFDDSYYVINTSGAIIKTKSSGIDGDDWYFYVYNKNIKMYTNNKSLKNGKDNKDLANKLPEAVTGTNWKTDINTPEA